MFVETKAKGEAVVEDWREVMARAADIIEERGLVRRKYGGTTRDRKPVCVSRALEIASIELDREDAYGEAEKQLREYIGKYVCRWVDSGRPSQDNIVATMRKVAELCAQ